MSKWKYFLTASQICLTFLFLHFTAGVGGEGCHGTLTRELGYSNRLQNNKAGNQAKMQGWKATKIGKLPPLSRSQKLCSGSSWNKKFQWKLKAATEGDSVGGKSMFPRAGSGPSFLCLWMEPTAQKKGTSCLELNWTWGSPSRQHLCFPTFCDIY